MNKINDGNWIADQAPCDPWKCQFKSLANSIKFVANDAVKLSRLIHLFDKCVLPPAPVSASVSVTELIEWQS